MVRDLFCYRASLKAKENVDSDNSFQFTSPKQLQRFNKFSKHQDVYSNERGINFHPLLFMFQRV